ncbi:hypothetical protein [Nocardia brasiliensis]|uniref:hypothetical protein n=1 Tax=Nocardia brasiliensis TaxID=37326 RepID=UPI002456A01A|nr:hypothetical protein [Nocardia brasiliensis]
MFRDTGYRIGEAEALANLGAVCGKIGQHPQAAELSQQAHALAGTARCHTALGATTSAATRLRRAIDIYRRLDAPETEAAAACLATLYPA